MPERSFVASLTTRVAELQGAVGGSGREEWFRSWFGEEYLRLYPHRDEEEAARAVKLFLDNAGLPRGRTLDLACGAGRHLRELNRAGVEALGLDLSRPLLLRARRALRSLPLVQADMRTLPFRAGSFAAVTSFFTSFGYFADPRDDARVAREIHRVLEPAGWFLIDYFNAAQVRSTLVAEETRVLAGDSVHIARSIEGDMVVKRIRIANESARKSKEYVERVRLYTPDRLEALLASAGLVTRERFGDYRGGKFASGAGRFVVLGRAE